MKHFLALLLLAAAIAGVPPALRVPSLAGAAWRPIDQAQASICHDILDCCANEGGFHGLACCAVVAFMNEIQW